MKKPRRNQRSYVPIERLNKLRAIDSSISSGLIDKVDSIYISVPWFRLTLMDRALKYSSTDSKQYSTG